MRKLKKILMAAMAIIMSTSLLIGCGTKEDKTLGASGEQTKTTAKGSTDSKEKYKGTKLSLLVSVGWMDEKYDDIIDNFKKEYGIEIDMQVVPADQYSDLLKSKLTSGNTPDIFWIQSNPFQLKTEIVDPAKYCIDFTDASWVSKIPEERLSSCSYEDKVYGQMIWQNSPEYLAVYNKTIFDELGIKDIPKTYDEFKTISAQIKEAGMTPFVIPGADGWQQQLPFFQVGGVYEQEEPGLYEKLNNNETKFEGNKKMLQVLEQMKEFSDLGYFGEDWMGTDSSNSINTMGDKEAAMIIGNPGFIEQIKADTGTQDEFGIFLLPFADNQTYPTNPSGPIMLGSNESDKKEAIKLFFDYVAQTENLQLILDNSPAWTNIHVNDDGIKQRWLEQESQLMESITPELSATPVLQTGVKYVNEQWGDVGTDMMAYFSGQMEANDILKNMDQRRAELAEVQGDEAWK